MAVQVALDPASCTPRMMMSIPFRVEVQGSRTPSEKAGTKDCFKERFEATIYQGYMRSMRE